MLCSWQRKTPGLLSLSASRTVIFSLPALEYWGLISNLWVYPWRRAQTTPAGSACCRTYTHRPSGHRRQSTRRKRRLCTATLAWAVNACVQNDASAMVTGPVQKSIIAESGVPLLAVREFLAAATDTRQVVMMLGGKWFACCFSDDSSRIKKSPPR